ncbi:MAG: BTAD domain-containing putative transcriptional regulator, partial [Acidimicrobiia bacterium]|nr:BTAD domain-containing putative transcriptional regulator [Acidimicrobiia bacterium]
RLAAMGDRIEADLALGSHAELIGELEELVESHGFHERFWGQLMVALYRAGRQAHALRVYRRARSLLGNELGIEPSPALQQLEQQILLQVPELEAPATLGAPVNLPSFLTRFVGRRDELATLNDLLNTNRLVTLAGTGGIGKTRTAVEVADRRRDRYRHGVRMIDLSQVTDSDGVAHAFADELDVPAAANRHLADVVEEHLSSKEMLLVVDNCEHVVAAAAQMIHQVLQTGAAMTVVATSREPLGISGEVVYRVPPLGTAISADDGEMPDAVLLFADRARRWRHDFDLDEPTQATVLRICERLEGIPLSIELASARLRAMALRDLEHHLEERFVLLTGGSRTAADRHQSLQAALAWSYELLTVSERALLRRLSVFRGGFTLDAVEGCFQVDSDHTTLDLLTRLVDTSLVVSDSPLPARYKMLETIREFAAAKLADTEEADTVRRDHATYFASMLATYAAEVEAGDRVAPFEHVRADEGNIRAALELATTSLDKELALEIAAGMGDFWFERGDHDLARRNLASAIAGAGDTNPRALLWALRYMTRLAVWAGDTDEADRLVARQRKLAKALGDRRFLARSLASQVTVEWVGGRYRRARDLLIEALAAVDSEPTTEVMFWLAQVSFGSSWIGDIETAEKYVQRLQALRTADEMPALEALIADARGTILLQLGELAPALEMFRRARDLYGQLGMGPNVENMLQSEAALLIDMGQHDKAAPLIDHAFALSQELNDTLIGARGVMLQGRIATEEGETEAARERLTAAVAMSRSAHDIAGVLWAVLALATLAFHDSDFEQVAFLHGVGEAIRSDMEVELPAASRHRVAAELANAEEHLGSEAANRAWGAGKDAGYDWAVALPVSS